MGLYRMKGTPKWWASWTDRHGVRRRRSARTADKRVASQILASWVAADILGQPHTDRETISFGALVASWQSAGHQGRTGAYTAAMWLRIIGPDTRIASLQPTVIPA